MCLKSERALGSRLRAVQSVSPRSSHGSGTFSGRAMRQWHLPFSALLVNRCAHMLVSIKHLPHRSPPSRADLMQPVVSADHSTVLIPPSARSRDKITRMWWHGSVDAQSLTFSLPTRWSKSGRISREDRNVSDKSRFHASPPPS